MSTSEVQRGPVAPGGHVVFCQSLCELNKGRQTLANTAHISLLTMSLFRLSPNDFCLLLYIRGGAPIHDGQTQTVLIPDSQMCRHKDRPQVNHEGSINIQATSPERKWRGVGTG